MVRPICQWLFVDADSPMASDADERELRRVTGRVLLIAAAIVVLAVVAGLGYLGWQPPTPTPVRMEKTIPNDKFQAR